MKLGAPGYRRVRPKTTSVIRALSGRRVVIEGYGQRSPTFVGVAGGGEVPIGAWLSPAALRRLIVATKKALK